MKLLGRNRLQPLYGLDEQTDKWLCSWISEISHANWKQAKDVLRQFPQARSVTEGIFHFRVGLRAQSIEVSMTFSPALAVVTDLKHKNS
jgi:mRNA-degrading endonuclease HigB of HigAB toxin-antitoxin module